MFTGTTSPRNQPSSRLRKTLCPTLPASSLAPITATDRGRKILSRLRVPTSLPYESRWSRAQIARSGVSNVGTPQSIRARFRGLFREATHSMAARYCFIDYDRELAIVAEIGNGKERRLIGIGRLVADPSRETAEFAILVPDDWQGHGLGTALTDYCLEVARRWGVKRAVAETESDNERMLAVFRHCGFELRVDQPGGTAVASRTL